MYSGLQFLNLVIHLMYQNLTVKTWRCLGYIAVLCLLISSCGSQPSGSLQRDEDNPNTFQEAVNQANSATTLSKSAKTKQEWNAARVQWRKALILMQSIPETDPNYAIAQQKLKEYQRHLDSAQKKAQAGK